VTPPRRQRRPGPPAQSGSEHGPPGPPGGRAIDALIAGPHTREAVDAFLASHTFPLVEDTAITFVYRGDGEAVHLKHWVYGLPSSQSLARVEGTNLWYLTLELPPRSRVEYKLEVVRGGHGQWMEDPLNPNRARDPFGANSVAHGSGYEIPEWIHRDPEARPGLLDEIVYDSPTFGRRGLALYLPARFRRNRRYPLMVVHDGHDYLRYAGLGAILDNLIHRLEIPDLIVACTSSPHRLVEYAADERHARFLTDELVPHLERVLPLDRRPQARGLMGASFGAVAALSTAWHRPGFYGRLLLQSGSFAFADIGQRNHRGPLFDPVVQFVNRFRSRPVAVSERVFVTCGIYESLIYENRSVVPVLSATGMDVRYVEAADGHNWENWRDRLREGLSWLFPGPLLLVYE
jgi:enterochelin esterase-like enzyme